MSHKYMTGVLSKKSTPQSKPLPDEHQVQNNAGGYVYQIDEWKRLDRFLILGAEGGTYYVKEQKLTDELIEKIKKATEKFKEAQNG